MKYVLFGLMLILSACSQNQTQATSRMIYLNNETCIINGENFQVEELSEQLHTIGEVKILAEQATHRKRYTSVQEECRAAGVKHIIFEWAD